MKTSSNRIWLIETLSIAVVLFTLTGCGQNIFKGLAGAPVITDSHELINMGNYTAAITQADVVINNPDSTPIAKQAAYTDKAIAIMGKNDMTFGKIATIFSKLSTAFDAGESATTVIDSSFFAEISAMSEEDAFESAKALNAANALSEVSASSIRTSAISLELPPDLSKNEQATRGWVNFAAVYKMADRYLDLDDISKAKLDPTVTGNSNITVLRYLFTGDESTEYFFENCHDAFLKSGILTESQKATFQDAAITVWNLGRLLDAYEDNTVFEMKDLDGRSLNVYTTPTAFSGGDSNKEKLLSEALEHIYEYAK